LRAWYNTFWRFPRFLPIFGSLACAARLPRP
jgi:hypothetical protein